MGVYRLCSPRFNWASILCTNASRYASCCPFDDYNARQASAYHCTTYDYTIRD